MRSSFALLDIQKSGFEVHAIQGECNYFRRTQAIMCHEMQDCVITPACFAFFVNRAQQLQNERPRQRSWWFLVAVGSWGIDSVESLGDHPKVEAVSQKGS
ncbi:hypothetical protein AB833_05785 [Chromatiales bacterium (ex Bugula neritina AB1)]|nr:hypothetical protein AB833_05785 [Chromatiales bacterium (ex Bugula neritina AB1)]